MTGGKVRQYPEFVSISYFHPSEKYKELSKEWQRFRD